VEHAVDCEVRLFDRLYTEANPVALAKDQEGHFTDYLNPHSLDTLTGSKAEPSLRQADVGTTYQFLRHGYFCPDAKDYTSEAPVFNRTVPLRDTWAKMEQKGKTG
jgi:glutaminyl-tRNA synthetase